MANELRPNRFSQIVGQKDLINRLKISIEAAQKRKQALSHILFDGPPGIGKTSMAGCVASALGLPFITTIGPMLNCVEDTITLILKAKDAAVIFIDEIHALPTLVEEYLYPVLEDGRLEIRTEGIETHIDLPELTFIGATTLSGEMSAPFRDRFPIREHLDYYSDRDLATLIKRSAITLNINLESPSATYIAGISRGTPRIANNRLLWIRDYAKSKGKKQIGLGVVLDAMKMQFIDHLGLDKRDRRLMLTMRDGFNNRTVGLQSLASASNMNTKTIEEELEPWLVHCGLIERTARGRLLTGKGLNHLAKGE